MQLSLSQTKFETLQPNAQLDDLIWLLDQCGFDHQLRAMPHKEIFLQMRALLEGAEQNWPASIEQDIQHEFLQLQYRKFTTPLGHPFVQRMFGEFWNSVGDVCAKSNLIDLKLRQIDQGAVAIMPIEQMQLPPETRKQGSKIALLLLFKIPDEFSAQYKNWALRLAFYETLAEMRPDLAWAENCRAQTEAEFVKLYRQGNRKSRSLQHKNQRNDFYKNLHPYSYQRKQQIIRCLLEAELAA